jgi:hypothetical protein
LLKIIKRVTADLKLGKYHIACSWVLLICFVAGQYMVYAHQHHTATGRSNHSSFSRNLKQQTVKEKCYLCDVMNHNTMAVNTPAFVSPSIASPHFFKRVAYCFISVRLILSGGRAPPLLNKS